MKPRSSPIRFNPHAIFAWIVIPVLVWGGVFYLIFRHQP